MPQIPLINDKGNASVHVRNKLTAQVNARIAEAFGEGEVTNKGFVIQIGTDIATGKPVYAAIKATITMATEAKEYKPKAKETVEVEVPDIFAE